MTRLTYSAASVLACLTIYIMALLAAPAAFADIADGSYKGDYIISFSHPENDTKAGDVQPLEFIIRNNQVVDIKAAPGDPLNTAKIVSEIKIDDNKIAGRALITLRDSGETYKVRANLNGTTNASGFTAEIEIYVLSANGQSAGNLLAEKGRMDMKLAE